MSGERAPARLPTWLTTRYGKVAACLHYPNDLRAHPHGVVLCPPWGHEEIHAHRSILRLADQLAAAGFLVARIDYVGTGDSEGHAQTPGLLDAWLDSIRVAAETVSGLLSGSAPTLLGLRLGALLAGVSASRFQVHDLVAWHPVVHGARYGRELRALHLMSAPSRTSAEGLEAGGFGLAESTISGLGDLNLLRSEVKVGGRVLILERDDAISDGALADHMRGLGARTDVVSVEGYLDMFAEPQYTQIPDAAIAEITRWMAGGTPPGRVDIDSAGVAALSQADATEWPEGDSSLRERHVTIDLGSEEGVTLRGVLSEPVSGDPSSAVLLLNAGSVHHVGPNRFYVELARNLARAGVITLRADLRNLGESLVRPCPSENHPYPTTAVDDSRALCAWLTNYTNGRPLWLVGLCSGAHTAFHAGLEPSSPSIAGIVCINPLTFDWHAGLSLDTPDLHRSERDAAYYRQSARDPRKWLKLIQGKANVFYILRFLVRRAWGVVDRWMDDLTGVTGLRRPRLLEERLQRYAAGNLKLRFIFSSGDPGWGILKSEAGRVAKRLVRSGAIEIVTVEEADHTFSRSVWRASVCESIRRLVTDHVGADASLRRRPGIG